MKHKREKQIKFQLSLKNQETSVLKFLITEMLYGVINTFIISVLARLC